MHWSSKISSENVDGTETPKAAEKPNGNCFSNSNAEKRDGKRDEIEKKEEILSLFFLEK